MITPYTRVSGEPGPGQVALARGRVEAFREAGHDIPQADAPRPRPATVMTNNEIEEFLRDLLKGPPPRECALPVLHRAQATLTRVEAGYATVRRDVGTTAKIPIRLIRIRLAQLAGGRRLAVSDLREDPTDRFNSAIGPLMAALPNVAFSAEDRRLYYEERS